MILNGDRDELGKYIRALADECGLRDWTIDLSNDRPDEANYNADVDVVYGRKIARIRFAPGWERRDAEAFRQTCVHELLHAHFKLIENAVGHVRSGVGDMVYWPLFYSVRDGVEYAVDAIASEWAKTLPLPIRDEAPTEEAA